MTTDEVIALINTYKRESEKFIAFNTGCFSLSWEIVDVPFDVYMELFQQFGPHIINKNRFCISSDNCFIHILSKPS